MRSSTRHSGAPPTSAARAPHGTSPFPVTRISQSRSAEDLSGARRGPSAARHPRHPRAGWMQVAVCSQTTPVHRSATSGRCVRFTPARGAARRRRPRTDHPLRAQHRRQHRRPGGRPDRRLHARAAICDQRGVQDARARRHRRRSRGRAWAREVGSAPVIAVPDRQALGVLACLFAARGSGRVVSWPVRAGSGW